MIKAEAEYPIIVADIIYPAIRAALKNMNFDGDHHQIALGACEICFKSRDGDGNIYERNAIDALTDFIERACQTEIPDSPGHA